MDHTRIGLPDSCYIVMLVMMDLIIAVFSVSVGDAAPKAKGWTTAPWAPDDCNGGSVIMGL